MPLRPSKSPGRRILAPLALVLACTGLALPAPALGAAKGIESEISWWVSNGTQTQDANAMRDLGASWTRITVSWHDAEETKGSYSSTYLAATRRNRFCDGRRGLQPARSLWVARVSLHWV